VPRPPYRGVLGLVLGLDEAGGVSSGVNSDTPRATRTDTRIHMGLLAKGGARGKEWAGGEGGARGSDKKVLAGPRRRRGLCGVQHV
jgi:hypothetical protein